MSDAAEFDLTKFDDDFTPAAGRMDLDQLADGAYLFEVESAKMTVTKKAGETILEVNLNVLEGPSNVGSIVKRAYFFRTHESVDMLGRDLLTLGFDSDLWKKVPPRCTAVKEGTREKCGGELAGDKEEAKCKACGTVFRNRPFSKELPAAVARMHGIRFEGEMKTNVGKVKENGKEVPKPFHNLYIRKLVEGHGPASAPAPEDDPFSFPPVVAGAPGSATAAAS